MKSVQLKVDKRVGNEWVHPVDLLSLRIGEGQTVLIKEGGSHLEHRAVCMCLYVIGDTSVVGSYVYTQRQAHTAHTCSRVCAYTCPGCFSMRPVFPLHHFFLLSDTGPYNYCELGHTSNLL